MSHHNRCPHWIATVGCYSLAFLLLVPHALAADTDITITWDANNESDLAGYRVKYGTAPGIHPETIDVGNVTSYTVTGLTQGTIYYLVVLAYDRAGNDSQPSNEVSAVAGGTNAVVPTISKTASPDPVAAGGTLAYTIEYANTGTADATGVAITDTIPASTTFLSATAGGSESGGAVTWSIGNLPAGASGSVQLLVQVASPLDNGTTVTNDSYSIDTNETGTISGAPVIATVTSSPVLAISKADAPDPAAAGGNINYTITYSNTGNADASDVVISETIPANTTFVSATADGSESGGTVTWNLGTLAAGAAGSVQLTVAVDSPLPNGTTITNGIYSIDSAETAPVAGAAVTTSVTSTPVLSISMTDSPDPAAAGSDITYTLGYSNTGNADATGVVISDTIPANTTFVSATDGGAESGGVVTWDLGTLAAGASGSVQLITRVGSPLANGTVITNGPYSLDSAETDPVSGAPVATIITSTPVLAISKSDSPDPVAAGGKIAYTLSYSNTGNADATGVMIYDTLPENTTFVGATAGGVESGGVVVWDMGTVPADDSGSVTLTVRVNSPQANGTVITNEEYSIDSAEISPSSGTAVTTTVTSAPVLVVAKNGSPNPVAAGSNITYTLNYSNSGNADATGVVLSDTVPENTTFVGATAGGSESGGVVTWSLGTLAAGASGSAQMEVQVMTPLANGTVITNDGYAIDSLETSPVTGAAVSTGVTSAPDLTISQTDAPDPVAPGEILTYTISYANTGSDGATGVTVTDTIPSNTTFLSASSGGVESGGIVTWDLEQLGAGVEGTVQLNVRVDSPLDNGMLITNAACSIDSDETAEVTAPPITTTVGSAPVLDIAITDFPDPASPGDDLTYTIAYENAGNANATNVMITDTLPVNTTFISASSGGLESSGVVTWDLGTLAASASGSVQLVVRIASPLPDGTTITNEGYGIDSAETAAVSGATVTTTIISAPVLAISMTDNPDPVAAGGNVVYALSYSNTGNADATSVVITDTLPADTTFINATAGGTESGGSVTWNIGGLPAGASGSVQLNIRVNSPLPNGITITNGDYAIDCAETTAAAGGAVTTTVSSSPILAISKADSPDPVAAGSNLTYVISFSNTGNASATGVVVTDTLPADTTFVSATAGGTLSGSTVTWDIGNLTAGSTSSVQLVVRVNSPLPNGTVITNGAYAIDSNQTAPVQGAPMTTTVSSSSILSVSLADAPDPVAAGGDLTYTITYSNAGNANATGVVITDALPADTTFVSASTGGTLSGSTVTWDIGILPAGTGGSVDLVVGIPVSLPGGTVITNGGARIDSNETSPVTSSQATTDVFAAASPAITSAVEVETNSIYLTRGSTQSIRVTGSNFQNGTVLNLSPDISIGPVAFINSTELTAPVSISPGAALGLRTLTVTNPDDRSGTLTDGLQVVKVTDNDGDCKIDGGDLNRIARGWNRHWSESGYDPAVDINGDGEVGPDDLAIFIKHFGKRPGGCQ